MIDSSFTPWPKSGDDLCQLLHISSEPTLRCHGLTKEAKNCTRKISAANTKTVRNALDTAASSGNLDAAYGLLEKLSGLVLCKKDHQSQGLGLLANWEKAIQATVSEPKKDNDDLKTKIKAEPTTVKTEPVEVKREPEEPTSEHLLHGIKPASPKPEPVPPSTKAQSAAPKHVFEPYGSNLTTYTINAEMKKKILKPLSAKELENKNKSQAGCAYVYTFPERHHCGAKLYLKIGYAADLQVRMKAWQRKCGYEPNVVMYFASHLYIRVERLVHAQLRNCRQREKDGCPSCHVKHDEWFLEYTSKVSEIGGLWTDWAGREPYDEAGNLKPEWVKKLQALDLNDRHCWKTFVNGEP